ncbi:molybdopterin molybdenumtransferase MoeA [Clostridioides difficile]|uniref:molybdopterin molybdotransferase MoeA n=1 Tax=unclassified Clostridioides TaxID=2635829 RepID=UPI0016B2594B|nr:molybdopterin molybdenumtransferase MoeA [Clostridioides difficile]MDI0265823.1 molybdopterin molybdotransferase MoeA [Clostridioides difficile]NJI80128.1 molybdopterin molybdotransferase MoeA [Clostridioides difficile]
MIELADAIKIIEENVVPISRVKRVNLIDAVNKVVAEDIYSTIDSPPFDRSPYDGYAYNANSENRNLKVIGTLYAGEVFDSVLNKNEAVKIMTGGKIPRGANCVVKKEDVTVVDDMIILNVKLKEYDNYIFKGEDIKKGQLIINKNQNIGYDGLGVLASLGISTVTVYDDLKVGILNTGTELQDINEPLEDGKIYDSNRYTLYSKLIKLGIQADTICNCSDDILELEKIVKNMLKKVDFLITTGGVSVGDKDLIPDVFRKIGAQELFWKINIKPGGACYVATLGEKLLFGLSGNPHAAIVVFDNVVVPVIEYLTYKKREHYIKAIFKGEFNKLSNKDRFVSGKLYTSEGKLYVRLNDKKDAKARLSATLRSNCMIKIKKEETIKENQLVDVVIR